MIKYITKEIAFKEVPSPSSNWITASNESRIELVNSKIKNFKDILITNTLENGYVLVNLKRPLEPGERGELLLELEKHLKDSIDVGITVWHESIDDKNSLRKLRGISVTNE